MFLSMKQLAQGSVLLVLLSSVLPTTVACGDGGEQPEELAAVDSALKVPEVSFGGTTAIRGQFTTKGARERTYVFALSDFVWGEREGRATYIEYDAAEGRASAVTHDAVIVARSVKSAFDVGVDGGQGRGDEREFTFSRAGGTVIVLGERVQVRVQSIRGEVVEPKEKDSRVGTAKKRPLSDD